MNTIRARIHWHDSILLIHRKTIFSLFFVCHDETIGSMDRCVRSIYEFHRTNFQHRYNEFII